MAEVKAQPLSEQEGKAQAPSGPKAGPPVMKMTVLWGETSHERLNELMRNYQASEMLHGRAFRGMRILIGQDQEARRLLKLFCDERAPFEDDDRKYVEKLKREIDQAQDNLLKLIKELRQEDYKDWRELEDRDLQRQFAGIWDMCAELNKPDTEERPQKDFIIVAKSSVMGAFMNRDNRPFSFFDDYKKPSLRVPGPDTKFLLQEEIIDKQERMEQCNSSCYYPLELEHKLKLDEMFT
jgi:hypothetical protein